MHAHTHTQLGRLLLYYHRYIKEATEKLEKSCTGNMRVNFPHTIKLSMMYKENKDNKDIQTQLVQCSRSPHQ